GMSCCSMRRRPEGRCCLVKSNQEGRKMSAPLKANRSGDAAGQYYTAPGNTPQERYANFAAVKAPEKLGYTTYKCPWDENKGPFGGPWLAEGPGPLCNPPAGAPLRRVGPGSFAGGPPPAVDDRFN